MVYEKLEFTGRFFASFLSRCSYSLADTSRYSNSSINNISHAYKVVFMETASCHGRRSHAKAARYQSRSIAWHGIFIRSNANQFQYTLHSAAVNAVGLEINENQVIVGAAADKAISKAAFSFLISETFSESLGICQHLRLSCYGMVVGTALMARKHGVVDRAFEIVHFILLGLRILPSYAFTEEN
ncbi:hypothetical protein Trco_001005 [Trichoderma cornu-damae]|uniref:Uncharacterized protein n=1 Tax=Trichoderma cornu-damae TaxID=654480 RepID=A0A9P8QRF4_9HYPO|nr:hypothetical protein Trco_001005 [Trichoderma cornu-damae]